MLDILKLPQWQPGMFFDSSGSEFIQELDWKYEVEKGMYAVSFLVGVFAFFFTVRRLIRTEQKHLIIAARLLSYKISLTVADAIILFLYAPVQFLWISTFWWKAGDTGCRMFKFFSAFGFHLTANMQVLVALDRLYITARMQKLTPKNEPYNTRLCLIIAWALALLFSFPQLLVFGLSVYGPGQEQCVAIWFKNRMERVEQIEYLRYYEVYAQLLANKSSELYYPNGTLSHWVDPPPFTEQSIAEEADIMTLMEQIYNAVHLATICVLPYLMELGCYATILYILKGAAQKGIFMSLTDVIKTTICCAPAPGRTFSVQRSSSEMQMKTEREPAEDSGLLGVPDGQPFVRGRSASYSDMVPPRATSPTNRIVSAGKNAISEYICCTQQQKFEYISDSKRPSTSTVLNVGQTSTPWRATVVSARRKARQKAFWMLSVNLLLWSPYCILSVMSTITVFSEYSNFQFVMALVAFNSVCNLLL